MDPKAACSMYFKLKKKKICPPKNIGFGNMRTEIHTETKSINILIVETQFVVTDPRNVSLGW